VTLAATYPKKPADRETVMVRISEHFYKARELQGPRPQVGEKFMEKFDGHKWGAEDGVPASAQCYYKDKQYAKAAETFDKFVKTFRRRPTRGRRDVLGRGESYRTANNMKKAFESYKQVAAGTTPPPRPRSTPRGRLALPENARAVRGFRKRTR